MITIPVFRKADGFLAKQTLWLYFIVGALIAAVVAVQQYTLGSYNNFQIFSASFQHLLHGENLYAFYSKEYNDLFLYNPTFPVLFAPLTKLPVLPAMLIWTIASMTLYLFAVTKLPIEASAKWLILFISLPDCINSLQHLQVNHINLALALLVFINLKNKAPVAAAFCTVLAFYIKIYPAAAGLCFLFFPNKLKYLAACVAWCIFFFALPLFFISFSSLASQYQNWLQSLSADKSIEECATSLSLISIDYQWLKNPINPTYIQVLGLIIMLSPLARRSLYSNRGQQLSYLAGLLLFIIIFNHAAESATYLLAVFGAALWYVTSQRTLLDKLLLGLLIAGTVLTVTDLFPSALKKEFVQPYSIRAVPCVLIWIRLIYRFFTPNPTNEPVPNI